MTVRLLRTPLVENPVFLLIVHLHHEERNDLCAGLTKLCDVLVGNEISRKQIRLRQLGISDAARKQKGRDD